MCIVPKSIDVIFFLDSGLPISAFFARAHLVPLSSMTRKGVCIPPHGLLILPLQLLLLFWPYNSRRAGFVLYYGLLSNKIVLQDRIEVQESC